MKVAKVRVRIRRYVPHQRELKWQKEVSIFQYLRLLIKIIKINQDGKSKEQSEASEFLKVSALSVSSTEFVCGFFNGQVALVSSSQRKDGIIRMFSTAGSLGGRCGRCLHTDKE